MENYFKERLKQVAEMAGNATTLARKTGISRRTIGFYLAGKAEPPLGKLVKIASAAGVSVEWLATGEGTVCHGEEAGKCERYLSAMGLRNGFVRPDRQEANFGEDFSDALAFSSEWLEREFGVGGEALTLVRTRDDAMEPTIRRGDLLLVDCSQTQVADNALYALGFAGTFQVKRIQILLDGALAILSDNPAYEKQLIGTRAAKELNVLGRVIWFGRKL
jgi:phage repressor protein C with HTH and peptisase S24 domain